MKSVQKIISFSQSDDHKDIYELKILVDYLDSTFWLDKGITLHQVEPGGVIIKYRSMYILYANMYREVDKVMGQKTEGV